MEVLKAMAVDGNPNSRSDAGVGALCARSAVMGAYLNVCINVPEPNTDPQIISYLAEGKKIQTEAMQKEKEILEIVGLGL
jgi:glutamate formiminotransferase/formiminotetrahydrofolate cyclodeaminase